MIAANDIRIANVYYMLAYAFETLRRGCYAKVDPEEFSGAEDMFGWILGIGLSKLLKQGLYREYVGKCEDMAGLRGRIDLRGTISHRAAQRALIRCEHDEFSEDNLFNRILKATAKALLRSNRLKLSQAPLKRSLCYFCNVGDMVLSDIRWDSLRYQRSNRHYLMLMNICRFVVDGFVHSERAGRKGVLGLELEDLKLFGLYESFVRNYFARHYDLGAAARILDWDVPVESDTTYLPCMKTDVFLEKDGRALIIDTKFYATILQYHMERETVRNNHLYQVLAYVNNYAACHKDVDVSGMLLYAKTANEDVQTSRWMIGGHRMEVRALDLNKPFAEIKAALDNVILDFWGEVERMN